MTPAELAAERLERISAMRTPRAAPAVRIYLLDDGRGSWPYWLCTACLAKKTAAGLTVRDSKDPPHPLGCDGCGRNRA
jgi:hypothetical protein